MAIQIGDSLPNTTLKQITSEGFKDIGINSLMEGKAVALFAVPGAYTPTCTMVHLPGFIKALAQFQAKGIDVFCLAVNDPFVLKAWGKDTNTNPDIGLLADWSAEFTKAIGLSFDGSGAGLGVRSQRYSMLIENGKVARLYVEENPAVCDMSSAEYLLSHI